MRFISAIYKSRRNFWCMTRGYSQQLNFQLQKVDGEPSGRQNWTKTLDFWFSFYIHFQRDPKGIAFRYIHFPIRTWCTFETTYHHSPLASNTEEWTSKDPSLKTNLVSTYNLLCLILFISLKIVLKYLNTILNLQNNNYQA